MSEGLIKRVEAAMAETQDLLAREMQYPPHLRKPDRIAFYERHIAKLSDIMATRIIPPLTFG